MSCTCLDCMIAKAKDYSHEHMSERLYTLITKSYKSICYRDSEIKRYLQYIVDKELFTEIKNCYLNEMHKKQKFYAYSLAAEYNTTILFQFDEKFKIIFFIKANSELLAYNLYLTKKNIFRFSGDVRIISGKVCM